MLTLSDVNRRSLALSGTRLLCSDSRHGSSSHCHASCASRHELLQSVSLESHGYNGGQKLEATRAVLVLPACAQNMNRNSPGPWAATSLTSNPRGALPMRIKGCVQFLRCHNGGRGPVEGAVKRGWVHACPTKPKLAEG